MYTKVSQRRADELAHQGYEAWLSPTLGHLVKDAPYKTGDVSISELPEDAFRLLPDPE